MFKIFENYPNLIAAVSERKDGSMKIFSGKDERHEIFENRKVFLKKKGIDPENSIAAYLCHGKDIRKVVSDDKGKIFENIDGLLTKEKGIFLTVTVADCLPVFLYDFKNEIVALIHAGWKGLESDIISEAISSMKKEGSLSENILAGIGPAIGKCHYEVGEEVAEKFSKYGSEIRKERNGRLFLDLKRIAELQLIESGVPAKNIETNSQCTFCEKEKYFSFRRDAGGDIKKLQAMMAIVGMKK